MVTIVTSSPLRLDTSTYIDTLPFPLYTIPFTIPHSIQHTQLYLQYPIPSSIPHSIQHTPFHPAYPIPSSIPHSIQHTPFYTPSTLFLSVHVCRCQGGGGIYAFSTKHAFEIFIQVEHNIKSRPTAHSEPGTLNQSNGTAGSLEDSTNGGRYAITPPTGNPTKPVRERSKSTPRPTSTR